jgi:hypothetical protein
MTSGGERVTNNCPMTPCHPELLLSGHKRGKNLNHQTKTVTINQHFIAEQSKIKT